MKKLLVLAIVSALAAPGFVQAETANVNVYGTLNVAVETVKAGAPTTGSAWTGRPRLASYSSNIGFKGSEDISEGLKGIFQIETDLDAAAGTMNASSSKLRNTGLGLDGGFGKVIFGQWDTPFKTAASFADPFYGAAGWMAGVWDGTLATRQGNSINYWTPKFAGVGAQLYYAPKSATTEPASDYHMGGALTYGEGPLNVSFAYNADNAVDDASKLTGMKVAAGYKLMDTTGLNVGWVSLSNKVNAADVTTKKSSILVSLTHKMGEMTLRGAYAMAGKTNVSTTGDIADTAANQMSFGVGYAMSKRTELYATYSKIANDPAASNNFKLNPLNSTTGVGAGADPQDIAFGVKHTF